MLSRPLLATFQIVATLAMFPTFFSVVSFSAATSATEAASDGNPLPSGWSAGVMNHGAYYRWWLIQDRPFMFAFSLFLLLSCLGFLLLSTARLFGQSILPQWKAVGIVVEGNPIVIEGLNPWVFEWRKVQEASVRLPYPAYPNQRHPMWIYEIESDGRLVRFATGDLSANVWGFYVPVE